MQREGDAVVVQGGRRHRRPPEEVEHEVGDQLGLLDVDEVAGVGQHLELRPEREVGRDVVRQGAPAHLLDLEAEHAEERHPQPGHPLQRPLGPPRPEAAEAQRRVDLPAPAVVVLAGAERHEVAQPLERQAGVHPAAAPGQLVERAGLALDRAGPPAVVEPRAQLGGQHPGAVVVGDVGHRPLATAGRRG